MKTYTLIMSSGYEMVIKSSRNILEEWKVFKNNPLSRYPIFAEDDIAIDLSKVDVIRTKNSMSPPPPPPPIRTSRDFSGLLKSTRGRQ